MDDIRFENAINFLMYSYFNLTLKDGDGKDKEKILNAAIERAYSDATQQGAYNTQVTKKCEKKSEGKKCTEKCMNEKDSGNCMKRKSDEARKSATDEIEKVINKLLTEGLDGSETFDDWHKTICDELRGIYREKGINSEKNEIFSYGNAQKWVNMSLKYLYILYGIYKEYVPDCEFCNDYEKNMQSYENDFHVPVDSYIIEAAWDRREIPLPFKNEPMKERGEYKDGKIFSWSTWDKENYTIFQESLHKALKNEKKLPLDWENKEWIRIAQIRKEREKEREAKKKEKQS